MEINSFTDPQPVRRIPIYTGTQDIKVHRFQNTRVKLHRAFASLGFVFAGLTVALLGLGSMTDFGTSSIEPQQAMITPAVYLGEKASAAELSYGPEPSFSNSSFFFDTKEAFLEKKLTFISADLSLEELVLYEDGVPVFSAKILSKAGNGSWCETPSGLYKIDTKQKDRTTAFQVPHQKWSLGFEGNYFIHAWTSDAKNGEGCIRVSEKDALSLFDRVQVGTPVLIHQSSQLRDDFKYEIPAPKISAEAYLVADLQNGDILTSKQKDEKRSIASVTKLVTALVVLDEIPLETVIPLQSSTFSSTSVPRLAHMSKVSAYALLFPLLLESSNEAAEVFSKHVGTERFVALMNEKAHALGMKNTVFTDAVGFDDGNISTPNDLFLLSQYLKSERSVILNISAELPVVGAKQQKEFTDLNNFNTIDGVNDFIGGKIGETNTAGQTALQLFEITVDGKVRTIAVAILHSERRGDDMKALLAYVGKLYGASIDTSVAPVVQIGEKKLPFGI